MVDREGRISLANARAEEILGLKRSDIYNRTYNDPAWQITDFEGNEYPDDQLPFRLVKRKKVPVFGMNHAIVWPDGKTTLLSISGAPLFDSTGDFDGMISTVQDVTEQERTKKALEESHAKYRQLVEQSPFGISLIDKDGRYQYLNPKFKELFGYGLEDIPTGKEWFQKAYPEEEYRRKVVNTWKEDQRNMGVGEARPRTYSVICKDGQKKVIHFRPVTMENGDQLVFYEDVTETAILEKQLRRAHRAEAIATLTGGIAHDYNNLVTVITGNLGLAIADAPPGSDQAEFLDEIDQASKKIRDLTHELMALSRGGTPVKQVGSLVELLKSAEALIPQNSGISLSESISTDLWQVSYDTYKMGSVFRNVVQNAVEAMPDGGTLSLKAENLTVADDAEVSDSLLKSGDYVHIAIEDEGNGIPQENLDKLFDPYFSTKARGTQKGMGLGLATAYAIVKKHGGHINIDSTQGVGTTVHIYLSAIASPQARLLAEAEQGGRASQADLPAESQENNGKSSPDGDSEVQSAIANHQSTIQRILVMDDERGLRNLAQKMLKRFGYESETVKNGVEAIEVYKAHLNSDDPFDAVILDLTIKGGMGGDQAIKELIKIDPNVKAIVSSGYFNDPVMTNFQDYGFKGAMAKPYQMKDLKGVLEKVLSVRN